MLGVNGPTLIFIFIFHVDHYSFSANVARVSLKFDILSENLEILSVHLSPLFSIHIFIDMPLSPPAQNGEKLQVKPLAFSSKIFVSLKQYFHPPSLPPSMVVVDACDVRRSGEEEGNIITRPLTDPGEH